jgi:glycosyltransferase involved in cell wall biosynthesis
MFVVIPAYRPNTQLLSTVGGLLDLGASGIVIVDDGSGPAYRSIFDELTGLKGVEVLRHAVNLGKGAALKTGLNYVLAKNEQCVGVVTADADGQHHPEDIQRVGRALTAHPEALVLGVRQFDVSTPLRSRIGNQITRGLYRVVQGQAIDDTQTGLRGIPRRLAEAVLRLDSRGYEFELDMLILSKYLGIRIEQIAIRTIYLEGNVSSHFNPLLDSMRIYFVLLRFAAASAITALVDNLVFYFSFAAFGSTAGSQVAGRAVALFVSYRLNRQLVFHANVSGYGVWLRFVGVVVVSGVASYAIINFLSGSFGWSILTAKLTAESALFLFNFAFLRDFVFTSQPEIARKTDWSNYYQSVPPTAKLTRKYTTRVILDTLQRFGLAESGSGMLEFGGANSCFLDAFLARFRPSEYHVADTNEYGLNLLAQRSTGACRLHLHSADVLRDRIPGHFDLVYSVGLIEHFDADGTAEAVNSHFRHVAPGGLVLITFPRPTWLYRIVRGFLEMAGLWKFPDERPLQPREVLRSIQGQGTVLFQKTLWPLMLTQHLILVRAKNE